MFGYWRNRILKQNPDLLSNGAHHPPGTAVDSDLNSPQRLPAELIWLILHHAIDPWTLRMRLPPTEHYALDGLPEVTNLKLVNKLFNDEVSLIILRKFDGQLDARVGNIATQRRVFKRLARIPPSFWDHVTILQMRYSDGFRFTQPIHHIKMPRLKLVYLEEGWKSIPGDLDEALDGRHDDVVKRSVRERQRNGDFAWNFWLSRVEEGGKIMSCLSSSPNPVCWKFLFEISATNGVVITHRSNKQLTYDLRTRLLMS